jgi:hypothetical protein
MRPSGTPHFRAGRMSEYRSMAQILRKTSPWKGLATKFARIVRPAALGAIIAAASTVRA